MTLTATLPSHDTNPSPSSVLDVPFLDLRVPEAERAELLKAAENVLKHGRLVNGPEVHALELAFAARCNRKYAVGVSSGTDALVVALRALNIGKGDEVIVPALSFVATANAISLVGATPVFCDIGDDLNIDPTEIKELITPRTKAIMPVHWAGRICAVDHIGMIAKTHKLKVIEDASQAFGATFNDFTAGARGDVACFSMNPMKGLAALGEAGMIITDDKEVYERLDPLRYQGVWNKEVCHSLSGNHRLDTIQAAMLLVRLARFDKLLDTRRKIARFYNDRLNGIVETPKEWKHEKLSYYTYTIQCEQRDKLKDFLAIRGIETKIQHPILMPEQPLYNSGARGTWSHAQYLMTRVLCIPIHEKLSDGQIWHVVNSIADFYR
jgi:dTDP-4-amino-4,6-dideoxygalactose transaminase